VKSRMDADLALACPLMASCCSCCAVVLCLVATKVVLPPDLLVLAAGYVGRQWPSARELLHARLGYLLLTFTPATSHVDITSPFPDQTTTNF
jgi:hypothetical protein